LPRQQPLRPFEHGTAGRCPAPAGMLLIDRTRAIVTCRCRAMNARQWTPEL